MPRSPQKDSKNERSLKRELASVAKRLRNAEEKRDGYVDRFIHQLTEDRKAQQRARRRAMLAALEAQELVARQARRAESERREQALARQALARTAARRTAALCILAGLQAAVLLAARFRL
jgi:hypothetical protein